MPCGGGGQGRPARDAHGRGKVALLPAPRPGPRGCDPRHLAAHRPHGRPGHEAPGPGPARRAHPLRARSRPLSRGAPRLPRRRARLPVRGPGAPGRPRAPRAARAATARPRGGGRGALHLGMGSRLSPRLPPARFPPACAPARSRHRAHRHRHPPRPGRHRGAARAPAAEVHPRVSALEHRDRGGAPAPLASRRRGEASPRGSRGPAGDRLRAHEARGGRAGDGPRRRLPGGRVPRGDGRPPPRARPGRFPGRAARGDRGHDRLRHGCRQAGRPQRDPYRPARHARGLLPGDRPGRPRRAAEPRGPSPLLERPPYPRVLPGAGLPRAGVARPRVPGARAAARARRRVRPPPAPGSREAGDRAGEAVDPRRGAVLHRGGAGIRGAGQRRLARAVPAPARAPARAARPDAALRGRPLLPHGRARAPLRRPGGPGRAVRYLRRVQPRGLPDAVGARPPARRARRPRRR